MPGYVFFDQELMREAAELSEAVFSEGDEMFEDSYNGMVDDYDAIQDIREKIEDVYPEVSVEELKSFKDFDSGNAYSAVGGTELFYAVSVDRDWRDLVSAASNLRDGDVSNIIRSFEDEGLMRIVQDEDSKTYFYGENAFPYLVVLSEAEEIIERDSKQETDEFRIEEDDSDERDERLESLMKDTKDELDPYSK